MATSSQGTAVTRRRLLLATLLCASCSEGVRTVQWSAIYWSSDGSRMAARKSIYQELDEFVGRDEEIWVAPAGAWGERVRFGRYEDARAREVMSTPRFAGPTEASGFFGIRTSASGIIRFGPGSAEDDVVLGGAYADCVVTRAEISPDGARLGMDARCPAGPDEFEFIVGWAAASEPQLLLRSESIGTQAPGQLFWRVDGSLGILDNSAEPTRWFRLDELGGEWLDEVPYCFFPASTASIISPEGEFLCVDEQDEDVLVPCSGMPGSYWWRPQAFGCPDGGTLP